MKNKQILAAASAALCLTLALSACGTSKAPAPEETASAETAAPVETAVPSEAPEETAEPAMSLKTSEQLRISAQRTIANSDFGSDDFSDYAVYDIDGDGTEELIVLSGTCEADAMYQILAFREGAYVKLGEYSGSHSLLYGGDGFIVILQGHQGVECAEKVEIDENGELVFTELIAPHEVAGDYTVPENCTVLERHAITDLSALGE